MNRYPPRRPAKDFRLITSGASVTYVQPVPGKVYLILSPPLVDTESWVDLTPAMARHLGAKCFQSAAECEQLRPGNCAEAAPWPRVNRGPGLEPADDFRHITASVIDVQSASGKVYLILSPPLVDAESWMDLTPNNIRHIGAECFQSAAEAEGGDPGAGRASVR